MTKIKTSWRKTSPYSGSSIALNSRSRSNKLPTDQILTRLVMNGSSHDKVSSQEPYGCDMVWLKISYPKSYGSIMTLHPMFRHTHMRETYNVAANLLVIGVASKTILQLSVMGMRSLFAWRSHGKAHWECHSFPQKQWESSKEKTNKNGIEPTRGHHHNHWIG